MSAIITKLTNKSRSITYSMFKNGELSDLIVEPSTMVQRQTIHYLFIDKMSEIKRKYEYLQYSLRTCFAF